MRSRRGDRPGASTVGAWRDFRCAPDLEAHWAREPDVTFYPHQIEAAHRILYQMGGSGILADEVGLGKTFEAGLVLKELAARGEAHRALVLVPASLESQWRSELRRFFQLGDEPMDRPACHITSLDSAKRSGHRERLWATPFDVVIVDEAHRLKNRRTQNYTFVQGLRRKHLLLLTATPIENDLDELYALVNLVRPGTWGYMDFYREFIIDRHTPRNQAQLRALLDGLMIRRKRQEVGLKLPDRQVELLQLDLRPPERALYERVSEAVRSEYRRRRREHQTVLPLIMVQREVCSSAQALRQTLGRMQADWFGASLPEVAALAERVSGHVKADAVLRFVRKIEEPAVIFTEFRATQDFLAGHLDKAGIKTFSYHGSLPRRARRAMIEAFRQTGGALIATEAAGQGLNLQFCRTVINYDLPWNPMRVEQRIGRVHRLGQTRPVWIVNLFAQGTVEEHILRLLHQKIDLFRQVIGELDVILRHLEQEKPLERQLLEILLGAEAREEVEAGIEELGERFAQRRTTLQKS